jgi:hypothetical protein
VKFYVVGKLVAISFNNYDVDKVVNNIRRIIK